MSAIVRVRGLPYDATVKDISAVFPHVQDVEILRSECGKSKGEAYLSFPNEAYAKHAVAQSKKVFIKHRFLEIFPSTAAERDSYKSTPSMKIDYNVVKVKGIPQDAREADMSSFFNGHSLRISRIDFVYYPMHRYTGEAFVEFISSSDAAMATELTRSEFFGSIIEIYPTTSVERDICLYTVSHPLSFLVKELHNVVWLRGFPFTCVEEDVAAFLQGLNILPQGIHLVNHEDGSPTGEALVEMKHLADFYCAMCRHNTRVGHRYIEVFECCPEDLWMVPDRELRQAIGRLTTHIQAGIECAPSCTSSKAPTPLCMTPFTEETPETSTPPPSPLAMSSVGYPEMADDLPLDESSSVSSNSLDSMRVPPPPSTPQSTHRYVHNPYSLV